MPRQVHSRGGRVDHANSARSALFPARPWCLTGRASRVFPKGGYAMWKKQSVRVLVAVAAVLLFGAGNAARAAPAADGFGTQAGDTPVAVANVTTHQFTVDIGGVVKAMPASMGKPGHETPLGTFHVLEKFRSMVMDSSTYGVPVDSPEGYRLEVEYAVRITWSGIFVHSAPWSVDSQGYANVSHGCINLSPENARWFFDNVNVGDAVTVVD
ncbi:L,D-transpeptidase [Rhodococcus spelaei]|uniref:L,D-transpeptidase n=1 Tax=Rhodococcus spelaei TaxID=2546320 RepID=A0A541BQY7_9NOCA|nr:L,D-transpeptidase [Rhodococcus spelaei]